MSATTNAHAAVAPVRPGYGADEIGDADRWHPLAGLAFAILLSIAAFWLPAYIAARAIGRATGWF